MTLIKNEDPRERLFKRITQNSSKFTPSDQKIADYLLRSYPRSLLKNASEIANQLSINVSTVTRFLPKIGYKNIREAQNEFRGDIDFLVNSPIDRFQQLKDKHIVGNTLFQEVMNLDFQNIQHTFNNINSDDVQNFIDYAGRTTKSVFIFGERKEFVNTYYLYIQLNALRDNVYLVQSNDIPEHLSKVAGGDLLILFDFRRYPRIHQQAAEFVKSINGEVIVFTDSPISPSARFAKSVFIVETKGASAFDSYTAVLTLINALMAQLIKQSTNIVAEKHARLEALFKHFEVYSWQKLYPKLSVSNTDEILKR